MALALSVGLVAVGLWMSSGLGVPQIWLFGAGLIGLVGISAESFLEKASPEGEVRGQLQAFASWIGPGLMVVAGLWLLQITPSASQWVVDGAVAVAVGALLVGQRAGSRAEGRRGRAGRFVANLLLYMVAFVLFALIYHTKERSLMTATAAGAVALLAAVELMWSAEGRAPVWWMPALAGLVVAEATWALNYWPVNGLVGGAMLLLGFYVFTGLMVASQEGVLGRRLLLEYGAVAIAGFAVVAWAVL